MITISDGDINSTQEINVTINGVNTPPTVKIGDNQSITAEETLSFGISSSGDVDGEIVKYSWSINNIEKSTSNSLDYTFMQEGTFTVKLTLTDDKNATASDSLTVTVNPAPTSEMQFTRNNIPTGIAGPIAWMELADLDKDGDLDILATSLSTVFWYENKGDGNYDQHLIKSGVNSQVVHAADIDGDGYLDVLYAKDYTDVCFNKTNKNFDCTRALTSYPTQKGLFANSNANDDITFISTADIDGVNGVDIINASWGREKLDLYKQNSAKLFQIEPTVLTSNLTSIISSDVAYFNNDNYVDIVVASQSGVSYLENKGDGSFKNPVDIPNTANPTSVAKANINHKGNLDIITTHANEIRWSATTSISGYYIHDTIDNAITNPPFASSVDMDGDGDTDVVSNSNEANGTILWYENSGNSIKPSFTKHTISSNESNITITQAGDMDNDGDIDVVSADAFGNIFIYTNNQAIKHATIAPTSDGSFERNDTTNTVLDNTTGLTWRDDSDGYIETGHTWSEAVSYCKGLDGEWRLPTVGELITITDKSKAYSTAINDVFQRKITTSGNFYWTSTQSQENSANTWVVNFHLGNDLHQELKTQQLFTRCVKGDPLVNIFIRDDSKSVVLDKQHRLMWQDANITKESWSNAPSVCTSSSFAGFTDWRIPNINELYTIADRSKPFDEVAIKDAFVFKKADFFWAENIGPTTSTGYEVHFKEGNDGYQPETDINYVRCVRDIP